MPARRSACSPPGSMSEPEERGAAPDPTLRPANRTDKAALQRFQCWNGGEPSFIRSVQTTIRVSGWKASAAQRAVVIELDGRLVASARHAHEVSADGLSVRGVDWIALSVEWHGRTLRDGRRISDAVWQLVLASVKCWRRRIRKLSSLVASNIRSQRVSERSGWVRSPDHVTQDPADYETWITAVSSA